MKNLKYKENTITIIIKSLGLGRKNQGEFTLQVCDVPIDKEIKVSDRD